MRWFYATVGLLAACLCLAAWVYFRDRDTHWRSSEVITRTIPITPGAYDR